MTDKDFIDPKGHWCDGRTIRRVGSEGGEQRVIVQATEECTDSEWHSICQTLGARVKQYSFSSAQVFITRRLLRTSPPVYL